jgi:hypothetical protein
MGQSPGCETHSSQKGVRVKVAASTRIIQMFPSFVTAGSHTVPSQRGRCNAQIAGTLPKQSLTVPSRKPDGASFPSKTLSCFSNSRRIIAVPHYWRRQTSLDKKQESTPATYQCRAPTYLPFYSTLLCAKQQHGQSFNPRPVHQTSAYPSTASFEALHRLSKCYCRKILKLQPRASLPPLSLRVISTPD